jgi:putative serine/threonine protein kinase
LGEILDLSRAPVETSDFAAVLCYPRAEPRELEARIIELTSIGVDAIELTGSQLIRRARVLGKGCVGIVVKARMHDKGVALKIRRTDADRRDMDHEAKMLRLANSVGVGPELLAQSENFIAMELISGLPLHRWVALLPKRGCKRRVRRVLAKLLDDCYALDQIHLDHGELSEASKNVIVDDEDSPRIVDFETASDKRRVSNVTSIAQYLLIGGGPAKFLRKLLEWKRRTSLIRALQDYKQQPDVDRFQRIKIVARV